MTLDKHQLRTFDTLKHFSNVNWSLGVISQQRLSTLWQGRPYLPQTDRLLFLARLVTSSVAHQFFMRHGRQQHDVGERTWYKKTPKSVMFSGEQQAGLTATWQLQRTRNGGVSVPMRD